VVGEAATSGRQVVDQVLVGRCQLLQLSAHLDVGGIGACGEGGVRVSGEFGDAVDDSADRFGWTTAPST
jgi:hypothetical protein